MCAARRYNRETLEVKFKGHSIADLLDATVEEALPLMENLPQIRGKLQTLRMSVWGTSIGPVGHYAFRRRGAADQVGEGIEQARDRPRFYLLDGPTSGLHFDDVRKLLDVLQRLVERVTPR